MHFLKTSQAVRLAITLIEGRSPGSLALSFEVGRFQNSLAINMETQCLLGRLAFHYQLGPYLVCFALLCNKPCNLVSNLLLLKGVRRLARPALGPEPRRPPSHAPACGAATV